MSKFKSFAWKNCVVRNPFDDDHYFIDRVCCVGGDGMFSELLHGLLTRTQRDNGADHPPPGVSPKRPELRIGVIPGGEALENTVILLLSDHSG